MDYLVTYDNMLYNLWVLILISELFMNIVRGISDIIAQPV